MFNEIIIDVASDPMKQHFLYVFNLYYLSQISCSLKWECHSVVGETLQKLSSRKLGMHRSVIYIELDNGGAFGKGAGIGACPGKGAEGIDPSRISQFPRGCSLATNFSVSFI